MVSVIVPVYQAVKTLEACVESILGQREKELELILVDDGSTDGSGELCDRLAAKDKRIHVLHEKNGGAAAARNKGIAAARGGWLSFVDSDDVISPEMTGRLLELADDTGADIAVCAYAKCRREEIAAPGSFFNRENSGKPGVDVYNGLEGTKALLYQKGFISAPWGMISRRALWDDVSFPEGTAAEDMGTIYRLFLKAARITRTDEILYGYVQSASNTVFSTSSKRNPDYYRHSRQMLSYIKRNRPECLKAAASRHLTTCFQILSETSPDESEPAAGRLAGRIYGDIRAVRSVVIQDKDARIRNRGAAALSFISIKAIHRILYKRYLKERPRKETDRVALIEYQGRCDETGRAVGHAPKVLKEYCGMISGEHEVSIYAPDCIVRELPDEIKTANEIRILPHRIVMKGHPSLSDRIVNKFRMFANINRVLRQSNA
ncbi:MAG: glycosyltransferase, partial [Lachnospiraceae bacterium]|nr:glycosyltransferase [Lachnospiraceae bacterium]